MRKITVVLNSIVVVFFICFLVYTFVARQHLDSLARNFVTEKTIEYSQPIIKLVDKELDSPLVQKILTDDEIVAIRNEITAYNKSPSIYVSNLTQHQVVKLPLENANPLFKKIASIKEEIRVYYDNTLNALIIDLRIFSVSNLVAGLIAFILALRSSFLVRKPIIWFSFLMFAAVLYCSILYVDDLTFFRILLRSHMGWWYVVFLSIVIAALYLCCRNHSNVYGVAENAKVISGKE